MTKQWTLAALSALAFTYISPASAQTYELTVSGTFQFLDTDVICVRCSYPSYEKISVPYTTSLIVTFSGGTVHDGVESVRPALGGVDAHVYRFPEVGTMSLSDGFGRAMPSAVQLTGDRPTDSADFNDARWFDDSRTKWVRRSDQTVTLSQRSIRAATNQNWIDPSSQLEWGNAFQLRIVEKWPPTPYSYDEPFTVDSFVSMMQRSVGCSGCVEFNNQSYLITSGNQSNLFALGSGTLQSFRVVTPPVPEPSSIAMVVAGLALIAGVAARRSADLRSSVGAGNHPLT